MVIGSSVFFTGEPIYLLCLILAILLGPLASLVELTMIIPYYLFGCDFADNYK